MRDLCMHSRAQLVSGVDHDRKALTATQNADVNIMIVPMIDKKEGIVLKKIRCRIMAKMIYFFL